MKSLNIAIWFEPEIPPKNGVIPELEVHFNFWKILPSPSLDIGIKFPIRKGKLFIYIQNSDSTGEFIDLAPKLYNGATIRNAIFNDFMRLKSCESGNTNYNILEKKDEEGFCLCDIKSKNEKKQELGGTIYEINIDRTCKLCVEYQYVRFRVAGECIKNAFFKYNVPFSKFEKYVSVTEFIDFRLNNVRTLNEDFIEKKRKYFPKFSKIQCFLMCDSLDDLKLCKTQYVTVRALEKEIWGEYIKLANNDGAILAYQWKTGEGKKDFSLFAKIKSNTFSGWKILVLSAIFIVLNFAISFFASYAFDFYKCSLSTSTQQINEVHNEKNIDKE